MSERVKPPAGGCPKCGTIEAFDRPRYDVPTWYDKDGDPIDGQAMLLWPCRWCGYTVESRPLDDPA